MKQMGLLQIVMVVVALTGGCVLEEPPAPEGQAALAAERSSPASAPKPGPRVEALMRDLKSPSPPKRIAAADALSRLGPEAAPAVHALLEAMDGKQAWADFAMMDALSSLGTSALPILIETIQDEQSKLRVPAGRALWTMGATAQDALPVLRKLSEEDKNEALRKLAASAVRKIESEVQEGAATRAKTSLEATRAGAPEKTSSDQGDWPEFHGPQRDSICRETGLLQQWPPEGPPLAWKLEGLGKGLSTVSMAAGRFFTTGDRKSGDQEGAQYVMAYDLATRKQLWATPIGTPYDYGGLCTPTVDGALTYVLSTDSDLVCLETATGQIRWRKNLTQEFGGRTASVWKFSESPLVDGDRLIATPGAKDAALVAVDKATGSLLWKCALPELGPRGKDGAAYASPMAAEIEGRRQYVQVVGRGIVGVEADTGRFLWGYNRLANDIANITNPIIRGNYVFVTNSYNTGSALLHIRREGEKFTAEEVYFLPRRDFENHHGGVVLAGECVYGGSGLNKGDPTCLDFATGKILWKPKAPVAGSAAVLYADGHVIFRYDRGLIVWAEASPEQFRIKGSFTPLVADGPAWAHPVIYQKRLYLRHNDLLACYDLSGKGDRVSP